MTKLGRSRWEGCKSCRGKHSFSVRYGVYYCPACGKPMNEEAWVELERRIFSQCILVPEYENALDQLKAVLYGKDQEISRLKAELERRIGGNDGTTDI